MHTGGLHVGALGGSIVERQPVPPPGRIRPLRLFVCRSARRHLLLRASPRRRSRRTGSWGTRSVPASSPTSSRAGARACHRRLPDRSSPATQRSAHGCSRSALPALRRTSVTRWASFARDLSRFVTGQFSRRALCLHRRRRSAWEGLPHRELGPPRADREANPGKPSARRNPERHRTHVQHWRPP